ncbi:MAG: FAD-dependent 5-carboxymethylaminomethyl-2-thiouridine(34) oxidoreductase MnmC [Kordiimonadaceae bacterium]|jgi:tRNA 5-methylaminomethyl-2-thiouridine biosynthesis bifunctional protein|nr:FAD-dependent 5-carboxymethylaminomethyl-2-thiouridine(34) oxidoreductase MnmC [Kordiimonadaceae bacterium]MBT6031985.1 FAD-dependent 5-carboxymethylaminomethyl-2-thiouridine(34) oxidoreductase MnmC [Kordiimonadaceae bacterium]
MPNINLHKPWYNSPTIIKPGSHITVLGGGISGVCTAHHLQKNGYEVTLIERNGTLMSGASGNPAAILDPFIAASDTIEKEFYLNAFQYALSFYQELNDDIFEQCGLAKIAQNNDEIMRFEKISKCYTEDVLYFDDDRLIFPASGYLRPKKIASILNDNINVMLNTHVDRLSENTDNTWSLYDVNHQQITRCDGVILCNSFEVDNFEQAKNLTLDKIAGQISFIPAQNNEKNILCSDGYLTPNIETEHGNINICGATFEKNISLEITDKSHQENMRKSPIPIDNKTILGGRRGIRAMSGDHLPLSGPVANYDLYMKEYSTLHHGPSHKKFAGAPYHKNLFLNVGLGARGFLTAPLISHILIAQLSGKGTPVNEKTRHALHPARFIIRKLSKK